MRLSQHKRHFVICVPYSHCHKCSLYIKKIYLETLKTWSNRVNVPNVPAYSYIYTQEIQQSVERSIIIIFFSYLLVYLEANVIEWRTYSSFEIKYMNALSSFNVKSLVVVSWLSYIRGRGRGAVWTPSPLENSKIQIP